MQYASGLYDRAALVARVTVSTSLPASRTVYNFIVGAAGRAHRFTSFTSRE